MGEGVGGGVGEGVGGGVGEGVGGGVGSGVGWGVGSAVKPQKPGGPHVEFAPPNAPKSSEQPLVVRLSEHSTVTGFKQHAPRIGGGGVGEGVGGGVGAGDGAPVGAPVGAGVGTTTHTPLAATHVPIGAYTAPGASASVHADVDAVLALHALPELKEQQDANVVRPGQVSAEHTSPAANAALANTPDDTRNVHCGASTCSRHTSPAVPLKAGGITSPQHAPYTSGAAVGAGVVGEGVGGAVGGEVGGGEVGGAGVVGAGAGVGGSGVGANVGVPVGAGVGEGVGQASVAHRLPTPRNSAPVAFEHSNATRSVHVAPSAVQHAPSFAERTASATMIAASVAASTQQQ